MILEGKIMGLRFVVLFMVVLLFCSTFGACGDSEDSNDEKKKDTTGDDDSGFDEFGDDDSGSNNDDDQTDDDSTGDDDTPLPQDTEYDLFACELPDPESLGDGILFGGGPHAGSILVYVFDDQDCSPLSNAKVVVENSSVVYSTDSTGQVTVPAPLGAQAVSAFHTGYWAWTYKMNASVLYFRLRPEDYGISYTDSDPGVFRNASGGSTINLTNPDSLASFSSEKTYMGLAVPGVSRNSILYSDFDGFMTQDTFDIDLVLGILGNYPIEIPRNVYMPFLDVSVGIPLIGNVGLQSRNEEFIVPYSVSDPQTPMSGMILEIEGGTVINPAVVVEVLVQILYLYNLEQAISTAIMPLLSEGLNFPYVGMDALVNPASNPDVKVHKNDDGDVDINFTSTNGTDDYFGFLAAEIPNRAMVPLGIKRAESGSVSLPYARMVDADYIAVGAKTNWFNSVLASSTASFIVNYSESPNSTVTIDDSEFLPYFNESLWDYDYYTGDLTWGLEDESNTDIDWFWLVCYPDDYYTPEPRVLMAILSPETRSFSLPEDIGIDPAWNDKFFLVAVDMPDEHEDGFDPTRLIGYNNTKYSLISFPSFIDNILDWFYGI